jgi:hypothetical protein
MMMISWRRNAWTVMVMMLCTAIAAGTACSSRSNGQNSLRQSTGDAGSTVPKAQAPYYPNTSGNIIAPPGNPAGNPSGAPPLVGGNTNQQATAWPEGR